MTRAELYRDYKAQGHTAKETAEHFGVSADYIRKLCRGIAPQSGKNDEDTVARKIRDKSNGLLEYVSGYTIKENPVRVRCLICGGEFERTFHNITTKGGATCPHCIEKERSRLREEKEAEREHKRIEREAKASERRAEEERKRADREHPCPVCGDKTIRKKYCSPECARKADNKRRDFNRRIKLKSAMVDKDITVEGLYRRDNKTCYLCGRKCNFEDYTVRDGAFIAGDWYPSIDHVIPLAKGGLHSWDNVMLAHHRCNSEKRDKTISPYP